MKSRIQQAFDRASSSYARYAHVQREVARACAELVACGDYPAVLEVGAGAGFLASMLLPRITTHMYLTLDISLGMITTQVVASLPHVVALVGDGENPPFFSSCIDLLVSSSSLQWYLEPESSLHNNLALLRPGGHFCLALFVQGTLGELHEVSRRTGFGSVFPMRSADFYQKILANREDISWQSKQETRIWHYASVQDFLRAHQGTGAGATQKKGRVGRKVYTDFCREYAARYTDNQGVRATYEVLYLHGRKQ